MGSGAGCFRSIATSYSEGKDLVLLDRELTQAISLQSCSRAADHYNRHKCHGGGWGGGRDRRYPAFLPRRRSSSAVLASIRGFASRVLVLRSTVASAKVGRSH